MRTSSRTNKNVWILLIVLLAGLTVGSFLGSLCAGIPYLEWLNYGQVFGLEEPIKLDLGVIWISAQIAIKFTISGIIGIIISVFAYRKI
jgi:hypothetical protein